jgi:hypothetical protein
MRTSTIPSSLRTYDGVDANTAMCGGFGCFENDGTFGSSVTYPYIVYQRLNGRPDTGTADVNAITCS